MISVMTPGDLKISWKWMCCGFQGVRLQLGCCAPRGAGSVEAVLSQRTLKVCHADRLKLENVRCFCYTLCSPKINLLEALHGLSVDTHVPMCVFFQPLKSSHPAPVALCKALGCDGHPSFCLSRQLLVIGNKHATTVIKKNNYKKPVAFAIWCFNLGWQKSVCKCPTVTLTILCLIPCRTPARVGL